MIFVFLGFVTLALLGISYRYGRSGAQQERLEDASADIYTANLVRDRLERDAAFAARVRARFTR